MHGIGSPSAARSTIGRRISALVAVAVLTSVLLVTAVFTTFNLVNSVEDRKRGLEATGYVFASALADHVAANNVAESLTVLRSISRIPEISYAAVLDANGHQVTALGSAIILGAAPLERNYSVLDALTKGNFPVAIDIIKAGSKAGQVLLIADVSDLRYLMARNILLGLAVAALASLAGLLLARRLRRHITQPMHQLTEVMQAIAATRDYGAHIEHAAEDRETGVMIDSFNTMIREIRARDEALADHSRNLESMVAARTQDLSEARDAAEQANRAKSSFLSTMSHEIRTPLNGLMVMAELLNAAGLERRLHRYAEVIVKSGQSLLTIINDILDLSKIEAGKMAIERVPLDPAAVADDVVSLFWENATSKGLDLAVRVAPSVPQLVSADPVRLNQILSNLVNNALKFTAQGQVLVTLQYAAGQLSVSVADSGIGIARDKLHSLFEAFTQADQSITRKFGGTGLGLAICKRLAEAMGGGIAVRSEPGKGSLFTVTIAAPMVAPAAVYAASQPPGRKAVLAFAGNASLSALGTALTSARYDVAMAGAIPLDCDVVFATAAGIATLSFAAGCRPRVIGLVGMGDTRGEAAIASGAADDLLSLPLRPAEVHDMLARLAAGTLRGKALLNRHGETQVLGPDFTGRRVLVADDNAINREVIIEVLRQLGIAVETAVNGLDAVECWRRTRPDLVFMDCSMPEMDGYAACREIRAHEALDLGAGRTPVVALTARMAGSNADDWRAAGMDAYLTKPFSLKTIVACLEAQFTGKPLPIAETPAAMASTGPALDASTLDELRTIGGSDALFRRVLDLFLTRVPSSLDSVQRAASGADLQALADAAHALKSMCANVGAGRAVAACHRLEHAARSATGADITTLMSDILREVRYAAAEVQRLKAA